MKPSDLRPCEIYLCENGSVITKCLFHKWVVVDNGGIDRIVGIIEYADGWIEEYPTGYIKFTDREEDRE